MLRRHVKRCAAHHMERDGPRQAGSRAGVRRCALATLAVLAAACSDSLAPRPVERWGAAGIELRLLDREAELLLDCTTAVVPNVVGFAPDGSISGVALVIAGPRKGERIPFGGQRMGDSLFLTVELPASGALHLDAGFTLVRGSAGTFDPGPCP
jgi:hypothetical protein